MSNSPIKVHTTETLRRRVIIGSELFKQPAGESGNEGTKLCRRIESAEFEGRLEVYIDLAKILDHYAQVAFDNKARRFIRGPIEVRVVDCREVPGTRSQETR